MKYLKKLSYYLQVGNLIPRIRGVICGLKNSKSSTRTRIYSPTKYTSRYIELGKGVTIYKNCRIQGISQYLGVNFEPLICLQSGVTIQQNCHITCAKKIIIGKDTAIASNVTITDIDHPYEDIRIAPEQQPLIVKSVTIGEDCKIYNNAVVLSGVTIGKHCVIGANSVVTKDIPDYCVAVGIPAKIVKRYNFEKAQWMKTNPNGEFIYL